MFKTIFDSKGSGAKKHKKRDPNLDLLEFLNEDV